MKMKENKRVFRSHIIIALLTTIFMLSAWSSAQAVQPQVAASVYHTVGLRSDGRVLAAGDNDYGQLAVGLWTGIIQVATDLSHTVGLRSDGTVEAVGYNGHGELNVGLWTSITQVAAGGEHTVGLRSDGTVVAVGWNGFGQLDVESWDDITQVAAGRHHTVGLRSDGTVVAVGRNDDDQLNTGSWTGITQVAAGVYHTVGVTSDNKVVVVGSNSFGQLNVESWDNITQVAAGTWHTVGLRSDGTVVAVGWNDHGQLAVGLWTGIIKVAAGEAHTVGLISDGTVVAVGGNDYGQSSDVSRWNLYSPTRKYALKVKKAKKNKGDGVVTSTDGNIDCGDTCSYAYYKDTVVTLSAEANEGSTFLGWKPATLNCTGTDPCTVTIDKAKSVQAVFVGDYALKVTAQSKKKGTGTVTSIPIGINCTTGSKENCAALYGYYEAVTLSASPDSGSTFLGWTPAKLCSGTGVCMVTMEKKRTIKAVFSVP